MSRKLHDILSELATDVRSLSLDDRISFRYLHQKFNSKIEYFLRQEARSREIFKDVSLWKPINYIELIDVNNNVCGFIDNCNSLKRSKFKIPEAFNTNYGLLIKILTLDGLSELKLINSADYSSYTKREYNTNKLVYWIHDGYIYIPNTILEAVKGLIMPKDASAIDKLNGVISKCSSPLDGIVTYPDFLITIAKQEVLKEISDVYKRTVEDERGDDNTNSKQ